MPRMLGKLAAVQHPNAVLLAAYLPEKHLPVPEKVDNYSAITDWGMMRNDTLSDCTIAGAGHMVQAWTKLACGKEVVISDEEIVAAYSSITGYDPSQGSGENNPTDQGAVEVDVLDHWRKEGIGGHKIYAHAVVETESEYQVKLATWLFGAVYAGVELPLSAQDQKLWTVVPGHDSKPGSWGGHAIPLLGYDEHRPTCITWGAPLQMTWSWWRKYADEAHACLSLDWIDQASQAAPNHLKWDELATDLQKRFHQEKTNG